MKRIYGIIMTVVAVGLVAYSPVWGEKASGTDPHHGCMWRHGHGSGHGYMMGHGHGGSVAKKPHDWHHMTTEQKDLWKGMVATFNLETLEIRQQLAVRKIELQTLWSQEDLDEGRIEKLSGEVADLKAQLWKIHDRYVVKCRTTFGEKGWECPGHG